MGNGARKARAKRVQRKYAKRENVKNSAIVKTISNMKGRFFTGRFKCEMCKHTRMFGYLYTTENAEYEICKFCHDDIFDVGHHSKVLYTPMGNKR